MSAALPDLRTLNRTYLHRQLLLNRADLSVPAAVEHLIGLQAQLTNPPYIGLWTRLNTAPRSAVTAHIESREIVRAAFWRSTLHLVTADDHTRLRPLTLPALVKALNSFFGTRAKALDPLPLIETARSVLAGNALTMGEMKTRLAALAPDLVGEADADAVNYLVRTYLPLVQVFPGGTWGSGSARYALAEEYLPAAALAVPVLDLPALFRRFLAACGPASVKDFQTWTGLTKLDATVLTAGLTTYGSGSKALYDLPGQTLIDGGTPAPARFIPEYDNALISHADRTRILPETYRTQVFLSAARVLNTFLIDGFVQGVWKAEIEKRGGATLVVRPFAPLTAADKTALEAEGEPLLRCIAPDAASFSVRFETA